MNTMECPSCALEVEKGLETCPYCGYEYPETKNGRTFMAWLFAALLLLPVLYVLFRILQ